MRGNQMSAEFYQGKLANKIRIGDVEMRYNKTAESLAGWVEEHGVQRGLSPEYMMVILLDKAVGLAIRQADDDDHARRIVNEVVEDHIKERRKQNEQN